MAHLVNLDDISRGQASADVMWQTMGGVMCWLRVAELTGQGVDEMQAQYDLMMRVVERYEVTGRVLFTGPEYQLAKIGVDLMDLLAETVDRDTAIAAADYAEALVQQIEAKHRAQTAHAETRQA